MKNVFKLRFLFITIALVLFFRSNASHVTGSDISWQCVGQDSFLVKLVVLRDCNGIVLAPGNLTFKCATTNATITGVSMNPGTPIDITPVCKTSCTRCQSVSCSFPYGIHQYTMQQLVVLSGAGTCCSIQMSWEQCCRSSAITTGGGSANFYVQALMNRCQNPCDNSPVFTTPPITIACVGQDFTYSPGVVDMDINLNGQADSMIYEWSQPLQGPGSPIGYTGQYAYNKPIYFWGFPNDALPFPRGIHLDERTGDIQFRPMKAEITLMLLKVSEYRNHVKIGEISRDMQVIVIPCSTNNPPVVTTSNNIWEITSKAGDTVSFNFSTSDPNANDSITLSWNNAIPGATFTTTNGQVKNPTANFTWITDTFNSSTNPYVFTITAKDNACPVNAQFSLAFRINLVHYIYLNNLNISKTYTKCGYYDLNILNSNPMANYTWVGDNFNFDQTTGINIQHNFKKPGIYRFSIKTRLNNLFYICRDSVIVPNYTYAILPNDTTIYNCDTLYIKPFINKTSNNHFLWSTGDTKDYLSLGASKADVKLKFTIQDSACSYTDSMTVKRKIYQVYFQQKDTNLCYGNALSLAPMIYADKNKRYINWSTGDTTITYYTGFLYNDSQYSIKVTDSNLCSSTDTFKVKIVYADPLPKEKWVCYGSSTTIYPNLNCLTGFKNILWSTGATTQSTSAGPLYSDSAISVILTDLNNVVYYDTIRIKIHRPEAVLPADFTACYGSTKYLTASTKNTKGLVSYLWNNGSTGQTVYYGPLKSVSPIILRITDYYAKDGISCTDYDSMKYKLTPLPVAIIHYSGQPVFCDNSSFLLWADIYPKYTYEWYSGSNYEGGGNRHYVTKAGSYSLKVWDSLGCVDTSATLNIKSLNSNFNLEFIAAPRFITQPPFNVAFDNLTPNKNNFNFMWYFGDGDSSKILNPFHTYKKNGLYKVILIAASVTSGCKDVSTKTDYVSCSGMNGIDGPNASQNNLSIYPNPAFDFLNIEFANAPDQNCEMQLFNSSGQIIYKYHLADKVNTIGLSNFSTGIYLLKIVSDKISYQGVILKE